MSKRRLSTLPPRYSFILNPYSDERLSKCPCCHRPTHPRKFAFLVHVESFGPLAIGKTGRYCTPCELIVLHQDELESELAHHLNRLAPTAVGEEYFVVGTMDKKIWQKGLTEGGTDMSSSLDHTAVFKTVLKLEVKGGWGPAYLRD
jgi:hypothetical protein